MLCKKEVCDLPEGGGALLCGALGRWITAIRNRSQGLLGEDARLIGSDLSNGPERNPASRGFASGPHTVLHDIGHRSRWLDANTEADKFGIPAEELGPLRPQTIDNALGDPGQCSSSVRAAGPGASRNHRGTTEGKSGNERTPRSRADQGKSCT